jgi:hypothetical protein
MGILASVNTGISMGILASVNIGSTGLVGRASAAVEAGKESSA